MSQAVKDLPDPLEERARRSAGVPEPSTDDLLSQMADEAITQLIADSDKGVPPAPPTLIVDDVAPMVESDSPFPAIGETKSAPITEVIADRAAEAAATAPVGTEPGVMASVPDTAAAMSDAMTDDVQSQLDSVLTDLKSDSPASNPAPAESPESSESPSATSEAAPDPHADVKALFDDVPQFHASANAPAVIVKPLQWLNAPFASLPEGARDLLGQVGIITLINALAVLLYVIAFRR